MENKCGIYFSNERERGESGVNKKNFSPKVPSEAPLEIRTNVRTGKNITNAEDLATKPVRQLPKLDHNV